MIKVSNVHPRIEIFSKYPLSFRITMPGAPAATNELLGAHWKKKSANAQYWKRMVWSLVDKHLPKEPLKKVKLTCHRYSERFLDYDGLVASFKPVIDGLVQVKGKQRKKGQIIWSGVLIDDKWSVTGKWNVDQFRAARGESFIDVYVEEVLEDGQGSTHQGTGKEVEGSGDSPQRTSSGLPSDKKQKKLPRAKSRGH